MLERLSMLLRVDTVQAQQQLHQELAGHWHCSSWIVLPLSLYDM